MPSGPAWPPESWIATPVFDGVPPAISGRRQICCARVTATYTWLFFVFSVMPLGDGAFVTSRCNSPFGAQAVDAAARIGDAALPLVGEVQVAVVGEVQVVQALEALAERGLEDRLDLRRS